MNQTTIVKAEIYLNYVSKPFFLLALSACLVFYHVSAQSINCFGQPHTADSDTIGNKTSEGWVKFRGAVKDSRSGDRMVFATLKITDRCGRLNCVALDTTGGLFTIWLNPVLYDDTVKVSIVTFDGLFRHDFKVARNDLKYYQRFEIEQVCQSYRMSQFRLFNTSRINPPWSHYNDVLDYRMYPPGLERITLIEYSGSNRLITELNPSHRIYRRGISVVPGLTIESQPTGLEQRIIPPVDRMGELTE